MYNIAKLKTSDRKELFNNVAYKMGLNPAIIEKDYYVTITLDYLFNHSLYKDYFIFKGGTSLSKCFNLISRFSEDIDLILDWNAIGISDEEAFSERSKTSQDKFSKHVNQLADAFIKEKLLKDLRNGLKSLLGNEVNISYTDNSQVVEFLYPSEFTDPSILQSIRLEIGPIAAKSPCLDVEIEPYCYKGYEHLFNNGKTTIKTVDAKRTFWEKVLILHSEHYRPLDKKLPDRYSRHYYDVYMMAKISNLKEYLDDTKLLDDAREFKNKFYYSAWGHISEANLGNIKLVPSENRIKELEVDYNKMSNMLFGDYPSFKEIISHLKELEEIINNK